MFLKMPWGGLRTVPRSLRGRLIGTFLQYTNGEKVAAG